MNLSMLYSIVGVCLLWMGYHVVNAEWDKFLVPMAIAFFAVIGIAFQFLR